MKICVIGNSHVASLKLGWDRVAAEFPGVELCFFAAKGHMMSGLEVEGGKLVSGNNKLGTLLARFSDGVSEIRPQDFDAFVLYGLALYLPRLEVGSSKELRRAAAKDYLSNSVVLNLLMKLRSITDKMIWIGPCPMEATCEDISERPLMDYSALASDMSEYLGDARTAILGQPLNTVTPELTTPFGFCNAAIHLQVSSQGSEVVELRKGETKHMNAEFGALWLQANLPRVIAC